jgi:hypothetical protein
MECRLVVSLNCITPHSISPFNGLGTLPLSLVSSAGIEIRYGLDGPGIESWRGRDFLHLFRTALHPPNNGYRVCPGGKVTGVWC